MRSSEVELSYTFVVHANFIAGLCERVETEKTLFFVDDLICKWHEANVVTCNTLIGELWKKEIEKALDFFNDMIWKEHDSKMRRELILYLS